MLASDDDGWDSIHCSPTEMPKDWGQFFPDVIKLKDVKRGFYKNELLSPNKFKYMLPSNYNSIKKILLEEVRKCQEKRMIIKVYCVAHGHDHYLGTWMVVECDDSAQPFVMLHRRKQASLINMSGENMRSQSECKHQIVLRDLFPKFRVEFEPECTSGLKVPYIQDGRVNQWCSDFYTVDFVISHIASGRLISVESKSCIEDFNDIAKCKCRRLRDCGLRRVLAIIGHGNTIKFYDFSDNTSSEKWITKDDLAILQSGI